nr:3'-5' exonuclease [Pontibacter silvestris]
MFIDTETTGLPKEWNKPYSEEGNWPNSVQVAWTIYTKEGQEVKTENHFIKDKDFKIEAASRKIHGITHDFLLKNGEDRNVVMARLSEDLLQYKPMVVGHFMLLDFHMLGADFYRAGMQNPIKELPTFCTMKATANYVFNPYQKFLRLGDLYERLFGIPLEQQHDALVDAKATAKCFFRLLEKGDIDDNQIELQQLSKEEEEKTEHKLGCGVSIILLFLICTLLVINWL